MLKIQTCFILALLTLTSYSQERVFIYKSRADKIIADFFDKSLIPNIKCTDVVVYGVDSNMLYYSDYEHAKNRKDKLSSIEFSYFFYSKVLNYNFRFSITVGRNKKVQTNSLLFSDIPTCVAKKYKCNIITKDSALKLAVIDSIPYPKNLNAELFKHYTSNDYFWFVTGSPVLKRKVYKRTTSKRSSTKNERIINAQTGEIIPYNEYFKH